LCANLRWCSAIDHYCLLHQKRGDHQQQEKDAKDQILLAQKQMEIMVNQYREALRPLIAVTAKQEGSSFYEIEVRNDGMGPALRVECDPKIGISATVIGSKSAAAAYISKTNPATKQLFNVTYNSLDGQKYMTSFYQEQSELYVVDYRLLDSDQAIEEAKSYRRGFLAAKGL
jgi:hypothetical protein